MTVHIPVLLNESIDNLNIREGAVAVDATLGGGSHSLAILERIGRSGKLVSLDADSEAIERFRTRPNVKEAEREGRLILANRNFSRIDSVLDEAGIRGVDAILADLGYSSDQLENSGRGLSFLKDGPLDMRLDRSEGSDASEVVNGYPAEELERILREYGEERFARRIAEGIVLRRGLSPITTTAELRETIERSVPEKFRHGRIHPATRTFQAIRIEVNRELDNLKEFLIAGSRRLRRGGRIGIISFHSLEDRTVKDYFRRNAGGSIGSGDVRLEELQKRYLAAMETGDSSADRLERALRNGPANLGTEDRAPEGTLRIVTRKPIVPGPEEIAANPRSRSAKLRVAERK